MRYRDRAGISILASLLHGDVAIFMHKFLRHLLTQIDRQEALREFDSVELRPQSFQNLLPLSVTGQAATWRASDAMLAVQLNVEGIEGVAARRQRDADGVVVRRLAAGRIDFVL